MEDKIPQNAIDSIAQHINQRNNKQYNIPIVGTASNPETPRYRNLPLNKLVDHWRDRWFDMRKRNDVVVRKVREFSPEQFTIGKTSISSLEQNCYIPNTAQIV